MAAFANTGKIRRPLVTVAGTMDALLPIKHHARAYARKVEAAAKEKRDGEDDDRDHRRTAFRLYEVQNGNHIETYKNTFPQLEFIQPHAHRAFQLLVEWVERGTAPPPGQCVPRGGEIVADPQGAGRPEHCAVLLAE